MKRFASLCAMTVICATSVIAFSQTCTVRNIQVPGSSVTMGNGVNKYDTVVGGYTTTANTNIHAYRWSNGSFMTYLFPNAKATEFNGNNDSGVIVGDYTTTGGTTHGLVFQNGTGTSFSFPGATYTVVQGINNAGTIVGYYRTSSTGPTSGFRKTSSGTITLHFPNATSTWAYAINDNGKIAGTYLDVSGNLHGFTYLNGTYTNVDYPGAPDTVLNGINKFDSLVGYLPQKDSSVGWQRKGGTFTAVGDGDANISTLSKINNLGDEVGSANFGGTAPAFLRVCR